MGAGVERAVSAVTIAVPKTCGVGTRALVAGEGVFPYDLSSRTGLLGRAPIRGRKFRRFGPETRTSNRRKKSSAGTAQAHR